MWFQLCDTNTSMIRNVFLTYYDHCNSNFHSSSSHPEILSYYEDLSKHRDITVPCVIFYSDRTEVQQKKGYISIFDNERGTCAKSASQRNQYRYLSFGTTEIVDGEEEIKHFKLVMNRKLAKYNVSLLKLNSSSDCSTFFTADFMESSISINKCDPPKNAINGKELVQRWIGELVLSRLFITVSLFNLFSEKISIEDLRPVDFSSLTVENNFEYPKTSKLKSAYFVWFPGVPVLNLDDWFEKMKTKGISSQEEYNQLRPNNEGFYMAYFRGLDTDIEERKMECVFFDEWLSKLDCYIHRTSQKTFISFSFETITTEEDILNPTSTKQPLWDNLSGGVVTYPVTVYNSNEYKKINVFAPFKSPITKKRILSQWLSMYRKEVGKVVFPCSRLYES